MEQAAGCRILAVMGSGQTSPTTVTTHKALAARLAAGRRAAVLLEAPYGFQENAAGVSARAQAYFARSVGLTVTVLAAPAGRLSGDPAGDGGAATLRSADWAFAGPGSPSYALAQWRGSPVAEALSANGGYRCWNASCPRMPPSWAWTSTPSRSSTCGPGPWRPPAAAPSPCAGSARVLSCRPARS